jgi:gamma-glutamylcyclotransferase
MVEYYFAYGSNMNPARVRERGMAFASHLPGLLQDYRLAFNKRSVKVPGGASANVVSAPGLQTEGILYRLTVPTQIEMMDPYEGYPVRYDRKVLPVQHNGGTLNAWVYVANEAYIAEGLKPARWYLNHLLAGAQFLSPEYVQTLKSVTCLDDTGQEPR